MSFRIVPDKNPIKAQKAGLKHLSHFFLCIYSPTSAPTKGHHINHIGQKKSHIIIPIMHHRFPYLDHQNFLVPKIGK